MQSILLEFPQQCRNALEIAKQSKIRVSGRDFSKIVFIGVGGSAIGSDLVKSYLYFESKIPVSVCREYELPAYVDGSSLVFAVSYSGNTEETLNAFLQAKERGASLIAISSGGRLKDYSLSEGIDFIELPKGLPSRCAIGYLSIIPLVILSKLGIIKDVEQQVSLAVKNLEDLRNNNLSPKVGLKDNIAKSTAKKLLNKFAAVYSASLHFDICALRFRSQINENTKAICLSQLFPEMNHNEILGWSNPKKLLKNAVIVLLRDKSMHPHVAKSMDIAKELLHESGFTIIEVWSRGEGLLSRIFSLIYIGDFISYYLAMLYKVDPTPADRITYIKKKLAEN